jgi:hypothetical protein
MEFYKEQGPAVALLLLYDQIQICGRVCVYLQPTKTLSPIRRGRPLRVPAVAFGINPKRGRQYLIPDRATAAYASSMSTAASHDSCDE